MAASQNSHHNSKTDCLTISDHDDTVDIYTLDDLIETLEEVASHLLSNDVISE